MVRDHDYYYVIGSNVLGQVNHGAAVLMSGLDLERLILAAGPVGLMQAAIDVAFPYIHERKQFNEPVGTFQVSHKFSYIKKYSCVV